MVQAPAQRGDGSGMQAVVQTMAAAGIAVRLDTLGQAGSWWQTLLALRDEMSAFPGGPSGCGRCMCLCQPSSVETLNNDES